VYLLVAIEHAQVIWAEILEHNTVDHSAFGRDDERKRIPFCDYAVVANETRAQPLATMAMSQNFVHARWINQRSVHE